MYILTTGDGTEHLLQSNGEILVALVHLEVHLAQVRCAVHANLHERGTAANLLRLLLLRGLDGQDVLPERSNGRPTHNLCPENPSTIPW